MQMEADKVPRQLLSLALQSCCLIHDAHLAERVDSETDAAAMQLIENHEPQQAGRHADS